MRSTPWGSCALVVFILLLANSAWSQVVSEQTDKFAPVLPSRNFGEAISVDGDLAIVGTSSDLNGTSNAHGAAFIFRFNGFRWIEEAKLLPSDPEIGKGFGFSVALQGNVALVGAPNDERACTSCGKGAAYVFEWDNGAWVQKHKLRPHDSARNQGFANAVALDGDVALIGAANDDGAAVCGGFRFCSAGAGYVFRYNGNDWTEEDKLVPSDVAKGDRVGVSVAILGDVALLGASHHDLDLANSVVDTGAGYVFRNSGGVWTEEAKLEAGDAGRSDNLGTSVALSDGLALIGSPEDDDGCPPSTSFCNSGAGYVFRHGGSGSWVEEAKLVAPDAKQRVKLGTAVALDGDVALLGAPGDGTACPAILNCNSGAAYLFQLNGAQWEYQSKLLADDTGQGDRFGDALALQGRTALISARADDDAAINAGAAYAFDVRRLRPDELLEELQVFVLELGIHHGIENALLAKLRAAEDILTDLDPDNDMDAIEPLQDFINQVNAQTGKKIAEEDAVVLIAAAQEIIDLL